MKYYTSYNIYFSSLGDQVYNIYINCVYIYIFLLGLETYTSLQNLLGICKTSSDSQQDSIYLIKYT